PGAGPELTGVAVGRGCGHQGVRNPPVRAKPCRRAIIRSIIRREPADRRGGMAMRKTLFQYGLASLAGLLCLVALVAAARAYRLPRDVAPAGPGGAAARQAFSLETVASGLQVPWALAW